MLNALHNTPLNTFNSMERISLEQKAEEDIKVLKMKQEELQQNIMGKFLPQEEFYRATNEFHVFKLLPGRTSEFDIAEYHFRYAESQFLR